MTTGSVLWGWRSMVAVRSSARTQAFFALIGVAVLQDHPYGLEEDLDIEPRRPVPQVLEVVANALGHLFQGLGLAPQAIDLGEARDAGPHLVADHVPVDELTVELVVRDGMGSRADQAHLALQHI